jgi:hypothetical protein
MALASQINIIECGASDLLGTGQQACSFDWNRVKTIEFSSRSYVYTDDLTLTKIREAQQKEDVFIIAGAESFKLVPVEPTVSTSEGSGIETVDGELPYKYDLMFKKKGMNFWKALRRFNSNGLYNVAFYDINGTKIMTQTKSGLIKGFTTAMVFTGQYKGKEGDTSAEFKMTIQLSDDVTEMERATWVDGGSVDYSINELDGYNDVVLTPSPLSTSSTSLVVKALLADKSHFAGGMLLADFAIKKNGTPIVATLVTQNEANKTYTFTIPAASAGTYTIDTVNTFSDKVVLLPASGLLYKGITGSVIVT